MPVKQARDVSSGSAQLPMQTRKPGLEAKKKTSEDPIPPDSLVSYHGLLVMCCVTAFETSVSPLFYRGQKGEAYCPRLQKEPLLSPGLELNSPVGATLLSYMPDYCSSSSSPSSSRTMVPCADLLSCPAFSSLPHHLSKV